MSIVGKSQSGRACAEPASRPSAPRSGGGAKRRALTSVSTRARCWLDDAAGDHDILRSTRVQFLSVPRARQHPGPGRLYSRGPIACTSVPGGLSDTSLITRSRLAKLIGDGARVGTVRSLSSVASISKLA